jgi:cyclopropane-fatty-acyl-phospholipid synthase
MSNSLMPHFGDVQAHYDLSDEFFRLFLDPTQTYSCAYFVRDDMTLQETQLAKIDLALSKLGLIPGMKLLDIGCGWGSTMLRAMERYDVDVIGLTLSRNQAAHVQRTFDRMGTARSREVRLQGWEQFDEPVDRIVSIGAFEHFGPDRYPEFFRRTYAAMPPDGVMLLHTICGFDFRDAMELGIPLTFEFARFVKFLLTDIFPGGRLPIISVVEDLATAAGYNVTRKHSLQPHYATTLDIWAQNLAAHRDDAVRIQSREVYDRYLKYLTGCAELFRNKQADVVQFTLAK